MSDQPATTLLPPVISTFSKYGVGMEYAFNASNVVQAATAVWPSANLGIFVPITLPSYFRCTHMFAANGNAVAGNIDLGIYTPDLVQLAHVGSTAQSGTSALQIIALGTEMILSPGTYYLALSCSSTSARFLTGIPGFLNLALMGVCQAASQVPLTANPTIATAANKYLPVFGISNGSTY